MEGVSFEFDNGLKIKLYSEFFAEDEGEYVSMSKKLKDVVIIGGYATDKIYAVAVRNGKVIDKRGKVILTKWDREHYKADKEIKIFDIDGFRILPLICFEIVASNFWKNVNDDIDLICHLVGTKMYNKNQYKEWMSFQKDASRFFEAPLICAVGKSKFGIDISGRIDYAKV
jgi:predicted amidohydrolase